MAEFEPMVPPIKKRRRLSLSFSQPKPQTQYPIPSFINTNNNAAKTLPDFADPRPAKRLCTRNHDLDLETQNQIREFLWELGTQNRVLDPKTQSDFSEYLRGLFDSSDPVRVFGSFEPGKNDEVENNKKKRKPWWKSVISRGCEKLRREKMRLRKPLKDLLFAPFRNNQDEEEEIEWKIEHKQDPFAFLSLPADIPYRL